MPSLLERRRERAFQARARQRQQPEYPRHVLSPMTITCTHCHALCFKEEQVRGKTTFYCCHHGTVPNDLMKVETPPTLRSLLNDTEFRRNIRRYNALFAFSSSQVTFDKSLANERGGVYTFKINGCFHHRIPKNLASEEEPRFAQLYIYDSEYQLQQRIANNQSFESSAGNILPLKPEVIKVLQEMITEKNTLCHQFPGINHLDRNNCDTFKFKLLPAKRKEYELPSSNEVIGLFNEQDYRERNREIRFYYGSAEHPKFESINQFHELYDPLHYVLLLPCGESSWTTNISSEKSTKRCTHVTLLQYYRYRLFDRATEGFGHFTLTGRLYHEYIVDAWVKVEETRLNWIRISQHTIRAETYSGLRDNPDGLSTGRRVILPGTFQGSPRFYSELYQDALAIVRHFGKPTFFLTFTTNPKWPDITRNLPEGFKASDRPDITCRVFRLKLKALLDYILKKKVLGNVKAYFYRIEFQKRGLPHAHCLFVSDRDTIRTSADVDKYVRAEIPDPELKPNLYDTVKSCMLHGPCTRRTCLKQGKCSKGFPKEFNTETTLREDGYPHYRREDNGRHIYRNGIQLDNRYVVPYNEELCTVFDAHINVEICSSIKAAKYLYKYVFKDDDHLTSEILDNHDEIKRHLDSRSVTATEAAWRLLGFPLHGESIAVIDLPVHTPNDQTVIYNPRENIEAQREKQRHTKLTEFFDLNSRDIEARKLFYHEIPEHYRWDNGQSTWFKRSKCSKFSIGRLRSVNPNAGEKYFLRILLTKIKGATSFKHLRSKDGRTYRTFRDACIANGFIHDGETIKATFVEICEKLTNPYQIFDTFADFVMHAPVSNISKFYDEIKHILIEAEDVLRISQEIPHQYHLGIIQRRLEANGQGAIQDFLPEISPTTKIWFNRPQQQDPNLFGNDKKVYNELQQKFFDLITTKQKGVYFLDGPGGTGKTYLLLGLCAYFHRQNHTVWICASSGIAATLYPTGKTAHSLLKIPLQCDSTSTLGIKKGSKLHHELLKVKLIVFDEVTMASKNTLDTIDRSFRDLLDNDTPFGGKLLIFGGDFRQLLPVLKHASQSQTTRNCCKMARSWKDVTTFRLKQNMRTNDNGWAQYLLDVGEAKINNTNDEILLPDTCQFVSTAKEMIGKVFGKDHLKIDFQGSTCILAPTNKQCDEVNEMVVDNMPGKSCTYSSIDVNESDEFIPEEFLNSIATGGLPNHVITLKKNCIIMCIRNLTPELTNGTRLRVTEMKENFVLGEIITDGAFRGLIVPIFKVKLFSTGTDFPFLFSRTQLPIKVSFCMTIHKAQCQTFKRIGILATDEHPCFSHGQLYVALSRVSEGSPGIIALQRRLKNVVFHNVVN